MAIKIPEGITPDDFKNAVAKLEAIRDAIGVGASQVSMRLNESRRGDAPNFESELGDEDLFFHFSYFVGSVQDQDTRAARIAKRIIDPGLFRCGDNVTSKEIREAVKRTVAGGTGFTPPGLFAERDWTTDAKKADSETQKGMGSKGMGRESGIEFQRYIGIKVGGRCVGTLGVSFRVAPTTAQLDEIKNWARVSDSTYTLVTDLAAFDTWGPTCP